MIGDYACEDGSTPDSATCADGSVATFYTTDPLGAECDIDTLTGGYCPAIVDTSTAVVTSSLSLGTVIVLGVLAYFLFGRGNG